MTRYFIHSRRLARQVSGNPNVAVGLRELDVAEAEPHLKAKEKKERRAIEEADGCVKPENSRVC
jgi:hypothetical protein